MSSRLQLDVHNLSLGMRHLVNAYEVEAGTVWFAGNTVWSVPERLECEVLQKVRYINILTFTFYLYMMMMMMMIIMIMMIMMMIVNLSVMCVCEIDV